MASVTGVQQSEALQVRKVVLEGLVQLDDTGTDFSITIPDKHLAPVGRSLKVDYEADILELIPTSIFKGGAEFEETEFLERTVTLKGNAIMGAGDDILLIPIPPEHQCAAGRPIKVQAEISFEEEL